MKRFICCLLIVSLLSFSVSADATQGYTDACNKVKGYQTNSLLSALGDRWTYPQGDQGGDGSILPGDTPLGEYTSSTFSSVSPDSPAQEVLSMGDTTANIRYFYNADTGELYQLNMIYVNDALYTSSVVFWNDLIAYELVGEISYGKN